MKKFTTLLILCCLPLAACADEDKPIAIEQLPQNSQLFIATHFANVQTAFAKIDRDLFAKDYEVIFVDGTQIKFSGNGIWQKIDCQNKAIPSALIPTQIASQVAASWDGLFISEMEKDGRRFDITLSNGLELTFDSHFNIIDYDH